MARLTEKKRQDNFNCEIAQVLSTQIKINEHLERRIVELEKFILDKNHTPKRNLTQSFSKSVQGILREYK